MNVLKMKFIANFCWIIACTSLMFSCKQSTDNIKEVDVCIYGGTSAGVIAAYTAKMQNKSVLLIEPGKRLGGLTSGGLGYTDIGNKFAISGLSLDFYRRVGKHYGKLEQWIFEPSVALAVYQQYVDEAGIDVLYEHRLAGVEKDGAKISVIQLEQSAGNEATVGKVKAKMFIDCSYEGDLMAKAGVSYTVGREANAQYDETYNGVQMREKHQFPDSIDPYKTPGDPSSGLVWGISDEPLAEQGSGDKKVQSYNFRLCLSDDPANMIPITRPEHYDSTKYELLLRVLAKRPVGNLWGFLKFDLMPNHKTDINNNGPFSTDMIGMNYDYPEASYAKRAEIQKAHEDYTKGLLYFIGHDPRMPEHLREEMLKWGYPKDEYTGNGNWSPQMYVRECRRMVGAYVMTQANCESKEVVKDGIGMAAYTMDSHNCQRVVVNGMVKNEGDVQIGGFGPYPISYRSIIPKKTECENLFVPVCLSATHIAYGSIRMEPVFMVLGQSAATAAVMAIDKNVAVQDVDVTSLQQQLKSNPLASGKTSDVLVDNDNKDAVTVKGDWQLVNRGAYGPSMLVLEKNDATASVKFTPQVQTAGKYELYTYLPKVKDISTKNHIQVFDGQKTTEVPLIPADVKVEGQTSGEWVSLGTYEFSKGSEAYIEVMGKDADGKVVADAILLVPRS
ncbi:FAD-dependent oxidoreductase [Chitinophaga caeni]|nr:FAD-dependent oxidoreductase [Chitinophaga caeni]